MVLGFLLELVIFLIQATVAWLTAIVQFFLPTFLIAKDIKGQTVLITGAGGGIGSLLAKRFADLDCNLVLWDIDEKLNEKTAQDCRRSGVNVKTYVVDLTDRDAIYDAADRVEREVGRIDILVNNAGIVTGKKAMESPDKLMELTVKVNTLAHFWMAKAFLNQMIRRNEGHFVTVASSAGLLGVSGLADYCASKFAAVGFEESLRLELHRKPGNNVKTTVVCPYLVKTNMFTGCEPKYPFIMDGLDPEYTADKIIDAVLRNQEVICLPKQIYILAFLKTVMPTTVIRLVNDFAGVTEFMDSFTGKKKQ